MKVLHLMAVGEIGGVEVLVKNYSDYARHDNYFYFFKSGGIIAQQLKDGGKQTVLPDSDQFSFIAGVKSLFRFCDDQNISVLVCHHSGAMMRLIMILFKIFRPHVKTIAYMHNAAAKQVDSGNGIVGKLIGEIQDLICKIGFHSADGVIAISNYVKKSLLDAVQLESDKVHVIYNGVELTNLPNSSSENSVVRMIYVGRLAEIKGVHRIISAISDLRERHDIFLEIVGDGEYRPYLENLAIQNKVSDIVRFHGNSLDVYEKYTKAAIFVHMPECEEGFGLTVVEAMSAGCVCVCAAKGGIPEIITDEVDGFLVKKDTADGLTEVLDRVILLYKRGECADICRNAVARSKCFSIQKYSTDIDNYIELIGTSATEKKGSIQ